MPESLLQLRRILIVGSQGQVGSYLSDLVPKEQRICFARQDLDLNDVGAIDGAFARVNPDCVINASAYTQVDQAESDEAAAYRINAEAPSRMASWCKGHGIPFVHYSTDYVFDGRGERPWLESDAVAPLNAYGRTKAAGERMIAEIGGNHLIFRTSWVHCERGKNFVRSMIAHLQSKETLGVVADQVGAPTYAMHLAEGTLNALQAARSKAIFPSGIYHLANQGHTTWYELTRAIAEGLSKRGIKPVTSKIEAIHSEEYLTPAKRPLNSTLNLQKAQSVLGVTLPPWEAGLSACMEKIFHENS